MASSFFTQSYEGDLVESVKDIMSQRKVGAHLPEFIYNEAVKAGKEAVGKSLEERRDIFTKSFNYAVIQEAAHNRRFQAENNTILDFSAVAVEAMNEAAESAGSFEAVADDPGSPLSAEDRARLNKRKVKEGAESAGSFEDVADDPGSPLSAEQRARLNKRKVREAAMDNLANFGDKKAKKFPDDKDGDGKVNEAADTTGTDKDVEDVDQDDRPVSVKVKTVREIDTVPVSKTHSFVNESWTIIVEAEELEIGEQHLLASRLREDKNITEAAAACPSDRSPFRVIVAGDSERDAIENLLSAFENAGSKLKEENVRLAHRTPK